LNGAPRTVLFIGAGKNQRRAIRRARELGLRVVAVDGNANAPGLPDADIPRVVDFSNVRLLLARLADLEIHGVLAVQSERAVPIVAAVAEELGLPGIGVETAHLMTHKVAMRRRLADAGVPQPRFAAIRTLGERRLAADAVGFPAVLKPANSGGQRGVFRVESLDDVEAHLHESIAASPTGEAILEEYVEGLELNGISVVRDGEVISTILSDRLHPEGRSFGVSWIHLWPPSIEGDQLAEAHRVASHTARALGLQTGIAFPQLMARPDGGITLVECGARLGGLMAELAEHALGIDLIEVQLRIALGDPITDELVTPRFERAVAIRFLTAEPGPLPAGRVTRIGPLDRVLASPGVVHAETYLEVGETINPVTRITDRRGLVIAVGETTAEALEKAEAGAALVEVEVEAA